MCGYVVSNLITDWAIGTSNLQYLYATVSRKFLTLLSSVALRCLKCKEIW